MSDSKLREIPKEGSNHIEHENGQKRSNISETLSIRHAETSSEQPSPAHDGLPSDVEPTEGENKVPQPDTSAGNAQE